MENNLVHFYYQYHYEQHYFLCHDILEETWKMQQTFSKEDAVVSLILLATGSYHYRRGNFKGAHKTFNKAYEVSSRHPSRHLHALGLIPDAFLNLLTQLIRQTAIQVPFTPIELPMTQEMITKVKQQFPHFHITEQIVDTPLILHHHQLRDRSDVIAARDDALKARKQQ